MKQTSTNNNSSNVRVIARIRPLAKYEIENGSKEVVSALKDECNNTSLSIETVASLVQIDNTYSSGIEGKKQDVNNGNNKRWFEFDAVFDGASTQDDVYSKSGIQRSITNDLFQGFNTTILAYGQTGAGKTHTMGSEDGLIPRCCQDVFTTIDTKCDDAIVEMSYLEIYNEEIRDLLSDQSTATNGSTSNKSLRLRETINGDVYAEGLECKRVSSANEIRAIMDEASNKRMVAATAMNATSSRSHAMAIIAITGVMRSNGDDGKENNKKFKSKLTLVDLAGSERIKKTGAAGDRRSEGININKSLLVLGQVVSALAEQGGSSNSNTGGKQQRTTPKRKPPYRDSKLTRLLQDSLGGNSKTIMIACVSPADYNIDESINTLRYATTARSIQNTATQNIVQTLSPEEVKKLQRENQLLKLHVEELQRSVRLLSDVSTPSSSPNTSQNPVLSPKTVVDMTAFQGDEGAMIGDLRTRIQELENELKNRDVNSDIQNSMLELPALKVEVEQLREGVKDMEALELENDELRRGLIEARAEAHAAQAAASKLSNIMDKLQELKSDEIDKKRMTYNHIKKEEKWVQLLLDMLVTRQDEMKNLEDDFSLVVRVVERCTNDSEVEKNKQILIGSSSLSPPPPESAQQTNGFLPEGDRGTAVEVSASAPQRSNSDNLGMQNNGITKEGRVTPPPRLGWLKTALSLTRQPKTPHDSHDYLDTTPIEIRQLLLKQHINFFLSKMGEIADCINVEEESLRSIRKKLRIEREELETEIGMDEFVKDSLCSNDEDLLQQLTRVLIGPIQRV